MDVVVLRTNDDLVTDFAAGFSLRNEKQVDRARRSVVKCSFMIYRTSNCGQSFLFCIIGVTLAMVDALTSPYTAVSTGKTCG